MKLTPIYSSLDPALNQEELESVFDEETGQVTLNPNVNEYLLSGDITHLNPFILEGMQPATFWVRELNQTEMADIQNLLLNEKKQPHAFMRAFELAIQKVSNLVVKDPDTGAETTIDWAPAKSYKDILGQTLKRMSVVEREKNFNYQTIQEIGALIYRRTFR